MSFSIAPASSTVPAASPASATPSTAQQTQLNRLIGLYKTGIDRNEDAGAMASLARQITNTATALRQHVTLPKGSRSDVKSLTPPPNASQTAVAASTAATGAKGGTVDLQA